MTIEHQTLEVLTVYSEQVSSYSLRYGKSNCSWASCKEGCTAEIFKCHQIRVTYTPKIPWEGESRPWEDISEDDWARLTRYINLVATSKHLTPSGWRESSTRPPESRQERRWW